ncbi:MAG: nucleotidyltransferase family protein, partial [Alphaproteobacteria bacterium]
MGQSDIETAKIESTAAGPAANPIAALLPTPFMERLVEPLFSESERAGLAARFLGAPLAYACARACRSTGVNLEALHGQAAFESIHSHRMRSQAVALAGELAGEGICAVAFKGLATALGVYPQPVYRLLPDVDFLFREEDLPRLAESLAARGYCTGIPPGAARAWGVLATASFAPIFQPDNPFALDVHRAVDEPPASLGLDTELIFARAVPVETEWGSCTVSAHEHSFAIAALNLYRDFYRPEALKGLFDGCLIISRFGDTLDWRHIEAVA